MKRFLIFFLILSASSLVYGQDRQQVLDVLEAQRRAWNKGQLEEYMQGYRKSDSLLFVGSNGPTYGWKATLNRYKKSYPDRRAMGQLTFDIKEVRFLSNVHAFVLGGWKLKRSKDEPQGFFTLIFEKLDDEWKIIADHSS